jgi:hypothetical protein
MYVAPKCPVQCKRYQRFGHTQRNCGYALWCVACGETYLSGECSNTKQQPKLCSCGGNYTASYRGCIKWKEANAAVANLVPNQGTRTSGAAVQHEANSVFKPQSSAEQESLGCGWNHVVRGGRVVKASLPTPSEPAVRSVTGVSEKGKTVELNTGSNAANPVLISRRHSGRHND